MAGGTNVKEKYLSKGRPRPKPSRTAEEPIDSPNVQDGRAMTRIVLSASGYAVVGEEATGDTSLTDRRLREASELRVLVTLLGPESDLGWDLAERAADLERAELANPSVTSP